MSRKFIKSVMLETDDGRTYNAEIYKTSTRGSHGPMYRTELRKGVRGKVEVEDASHKNDNDAVRTAIARLKQMAGMQTTPAEMYTPLTAEELRTAKEELKNLRKRKNPGVPIARLKQIDREMSAHVAKTDREVLYGMGAYGRQPSLADWQDGKDFEAYHPPTWIGGPYFSVRDVDRIYALGYRKIVFGGTEGFIIDLVLDPPQSPED